MKNKILLIGSILCATLSFGCATQAQEGPVVNIGNRHGNLRAAQSDIVDAYRMVEAAQQTNDEHLGGHAQRAKDLLIEADQELRHAANTSNHEGR
jgi:hypothetical protein